jgi:hypothetical protein
MHNARMGHATAVVDGKIYVMGGAYQALTSTATVDEYDPATAIRHQGPVLEGRRIALGNSLSTHAEPAFRQAWVDPLGPLHRLSAGCLIPW